MGGENKTKIKQKSEGWDRVMSGINKAYCTGINSFIHSLIHSPFLPGAGWKGEWVVTANGKGLPSCYKMF